MDRLTLDPDSLAVEWFVTTADPDAPPPPAGWAASYDTNCDTGLCCR